MAVKMVDEDCKIQGWCISCDQYHVQPPILVKHTNFENCPECKLIQAIFNDKDASCSKVGIRVLERKRSYYADFIRCPF